MEGVLDMVLRRAEPWVFHDLADLLPDNDSNRYEVVDGNLVVTPPPGQAHQWVSNLLVRELNAAAPSSWVALMELALPLGTDGRVPDVAVVRSDAPLRDLRTRYPAGPEWFGLVVEVVSPRTRKTDRFLKPAEYAAAGIPCFWRVELEPDPVIHGFLLEAGEYRRAPALPVPWGTVEIDLAGLLR